MSADRDLIQEALMVLALCPEGSIGRTVCDALIEARARLAVYEAADQAILDHKLPTLPWAPHVGPPTMTAAEALRMHRSARLSRTVLTQEERDAFVGDARPS